MHLPISISARELEQEIEDHYMAGISLFILGQPGIGKTSIITSVYEKLGLEVVPFIGTTKLPEDIAGTPFLDRENKWTEFYPPKEFVKRKEPFVLFLDELNASKLEVQVAFNKLIIEKKIEDYELPKGTVVVAAGNRSSDFAVVKKLSSTLINRMVFKQLEIRPSEWLEWALSNNIHPLIYDFLKENPSYLVAAPTADEAPFSTPRSWEMLSKMLFVIEDLKEYRRIEINAHGSLSPEHVSMFMSYTKNYSQKYKIHEILKGTESWPAKADEASELLYLVHAFRNYLIKNLPIEKKLDSSEIKELTIRAKELVKSLTDINYEMAQLLLANKEKEKNLPDWFIVDLSRDLPRLMKK